MSWKNEQYVPSEDVIHAVVSRALKPSIADACRQLNLSPILARVGVWVGDQLQTPFQVVGIGSQEAPLNAQIRLRFRKTFKPERSLFFAQLRTDEVDSITGFTGLLVKGQVLVGSEAPEVDTKSCTTIFHHSNWLDPA
jgi:hypothetical protein